MQPGDTQMNPQNPNLVTVIAPHQSYPSGMQGPTIIVDVRSFVDGLQPDAFKLLRNATSSRVRRMRVEEKVAALKREEEAKAISLVSLEVTEKELVMARDQGKIHAIKDYRARTGQGLYESKVAIEAAMQKRCWNFRENFR